MKIEVHYLPVQTEETYSEIDIASELRPGDRVRVDGDECEVVSIYEPLGEICVLYNNPPGSQQRGLYVFHDTDEVFEVLDTAPLYFEDLPVGACFRSTRKDNGEAYLKKTKHQAERLPAGVTTTWEPKDTVQLVTVSYTVGARQ